jgi:hypothetical protein
MTRLFSGPCDWNFDSDLLGGPGAATVVVTGTAPPSGCVPMCGVPSSRTLSLPFLCTRPLSGSRLFSPFYRAVVRRGTSGDS